MESHDHGISGASAGLLDMDQVWWKALRNLLWQESLWSLMAACTKTMGDVLGSDGHITQLWFVLHPDRLNINGRALSIAARHCNSMVMNLEDRGCLDDPWVDWQEARQVLRAMLAAAGPLDKLIRVNLSGQWHTNQLLPDELTQYCRSLRNVHLEYLTLSAVPDTRQPIPVCTSLRKLRLTDVYLSEDAFAAQLDRQLRAMPNIESLVITLTFLRKKADAHTFWLRLPKRFSQKLRVLLFDGPASYTSEPSLDSIKGWPALFPWGITYPSLKRLYVEMSLQLTQHARMLLQAAPSLEELCIHSIKPNVLIPVPESQGGSGGSLTYPCPWKAVHVQEVYVNSLTSLPFCVVNSLRIWKGKLSVRCAQESTHEDADVACTLNALEVLKRRGRLLAAGEPLSELQIIRHSYTSYTKPSVLLATLQLLPKCSLEALQLEGVWFVNDDCLTALHEQFACSVVSFCWCWWQRGVLERLFELMPSMQEVHLVNAIHSLRHLQGLCRRVGRRVSIHVHHQQISIDRVQARQQLLEALPGWTVEPSDTDGHWCLTQGSDWQPCSIEEWQESSSEDVDQLLVEEQEV